jgi:hypothetical protein
MTANEWADVQLRAFSISVGNGEKWIVWRVVRFIPVESVASTTEQETVLALDLVWTLWKKRKSLAPARKWLAIFCFLAASLFTTPIRLRRLKLENKGRQLGGEAGK